jgi:fumarate reductase iron-sulfur subunit
VSRTSEVFGCMSRLACHDLCPKDLPLQTQIAFLRRTMVVERLR